MLRKIGLHSHGAYDSGGPASGEPSAGHGLGLEGAPSSKSDPQSRVRAQSSVGFPVEASHRAGTTPFQRRSGGDILRSPSNATSVFPSTENVLQAGSQISDPLGLHLVYGNSHPSGDIIFVHGLGGSARKTWSWDRNVDYFWPVWLAEEDRLSSYRIFTYGYNSNFKGAGTNLNIIDFAKDLLFQMLVFSDGLGEDRLPIGRQPIIFVAHSMGGLVVKKAYVLGKHDGQYAHIVSKTHGIMFLATPHRGAHYAKILNNILSTAPLGAPPKSYVEDLDTHSRTLQDINEQFRTLCGDLSLVSFFETLKTSFGITKSLIVEKESGVLGYPQETSNPLNADHHTICKFKSREDGNYISVKSMLKLWASKLSQPRVQRSTLGYGPPGALMRPPSMSTDMDQIGSLTDWGHVAFMHLGAEDAPEGEVALREVILDGPCSFNGGFTKSLLSVLPRGLMFSPGPTAHARRTSSTFGLFKSIEAIMGVRERAEEEFKTFRSKAMSGTCQWITRKQGFLEWIEGREASQSPSIFWLIGLPAMGKTILASYVIDYLLLHGASKDCQYHFFSAGHQNKRTAAYCLRSIASQLAFANEEFRERLFTLSEETGISFSSQDQNLGVIWEKIFEGIIFKMEVEPLYWVLDAFDEADVPSTLISSLMKIRSLTPIRIFITSRPIRVPSGPATCGSSINTCFLSEDDTGGDIQAYVRNAVREALPDDEQQIRDDIIEQVLSKAGGSFLWVKLALETLHDNWHTQDDIRKVLTEMPKGMGHLYIRMLEIIKTQSPRLQLMAKRILTWTACCWRPLGIAELQTALEPEFSGFVRLQETIAQICGNFISMDNDKVCLIHTTARQFLLNGWDGAPAFIDSGHGHEHIATVCLKHLCDEKWKRIFKTVETSTITATGTAPQKNRLLLAENRNPFLGYSVCYYAYHVSKSTLDSEQLPAVLKNFFVRYCLSWIEAIALSRNLRYLTRSAQYLKAYAKRRSRRPTLNDVDSPLTLKDSDSDDSRSIHLWAIDFIRIVGKFGPNLIQNPSSVYRLIPPFCPRASMIGTVYGPQEGSISVTGLPSEGWDDCLASVSVGKEEAASKVLATDAFFLTLVSSSGTVVVWYAETCEEARRIRHGEYISFMEMSRSQSLLATAGSESYRIWDISSGRQLYQLEKTSRALTMAIAFGSAGSELIVGLDDCSVTCYDLEASRQKWQFTLPTYGDYGGCPLIMTISPDLTKLAVAWRGKLPVVWDVFGTESQRPLRCRVRSSTDALSSPLTMQWQADANSILILCHDTKLIEWHIYDEEQHEFDHVKPHEMTMSQDGNFLLTSNHMGTISVYAFPRLSLIYQLVNENEFIENLAFSPDGQRFYDIRGSICNVWEPDALVRPDDYELEDRGSSIATEPVIAHDESSQTHVTAFAYGSVDKFYCAGREDGTVCIHDAIDGKKVRKVSAHSSHSSIIILAWSPSGKYIISGDDSGRIVAKRVELKGSNAFGVFPVFDFRIDEPVQQFLLNDSEKLLLISTSSSDRLCDLKSKKELCYRRWNSSQGRRWIQHPFNRELLIWIDPSVVHTYSWKVLGHADPVEIPPAEPVPPNPTASHGKVVYWVALTNNKQYIVYLSGAGHTDTQLSSGLHLEFLSTSDLQVQHPHSLTSDCMTDLTAQIKRLIGTYQDRIVFLDHDYWLCTWRIDAGLNDVKRHFFLPKDWLNHNTLHMATLNAHGTFFCPKHGDVAIVRHGMRF